MSNRTPRVWRIVMLAALLALGFAAARDSATARQDDNPVYNEVALLESAIIDVYPHDPAAITRGLVYHGGYLYESAGLEDRSALRQIDPASGEVLRALDLPARHAGAGLARIDNTLVQLTERAGIARVVALGSLAPVAEFAYDGTARGLCADEQFIYMSNGTPFIALRDRTTFEPIVSFLVTVRGSMVERLDELECVGDHIYATVSRTDFIVQIDKSNGVVTAVIDAANLLSSSERAALGKDDLLSGIAYQPESETFLVTGQHWPKLYEVTFVETDR